MSDKNIYALLAEAAGRIGAIAKTEENREQHFKFRSIEAITAAAKPVFAELGIGVVPRTISIESEAVTAKSGARGWRVVVEMGYTLGAPDGSTTEASMFGEAIDYGDKATSKAAQMAYKYMLTEVLLVGGEDADAVTPEAVGSVPEPAKPPSPNPATHLASLVESFNLWTPDDRRAAYTTTMTGLGFEKLSSMERVGQVFDAMSVLYFEEFPDAAPF